MLGFLNLAFIYAFQHVYPSPLCDNMFCFLYACFVPFFTSLIQLSLAYSWAQFMYYIIFYSFKHDPSPCNVLGKLRKCGFEGMGRFLWDILHEPNACVLPSGQGTLVAPQVHRGTFVSKISTQKSFLCSS